MANASFLQAIVICVPIIFLTRENPEAYFIVLSVVLFILSGALLVFVFVPKILALKEQLKNKDKKKSSVRISGLSDSVSAGLTAGSTSSRHGSLRGSVQRADSQVSADPITAVLQQFQALSWEDKMNVKKKLGFSAAHSSISLEGFDASSEDHTEPMKDNVSNGMDPIVEAPESAVIAPIVPESTAQLQDQPESAPTVVAMADEQAVVQDRPASTSIPDSTEKENPVPDEEQAVSHDGPTSTSNSDPVIASNVP